MSAYPFVVLVVVYIKKTILKRIRNFFVIVIRKKEDINFSVNLFQMMYKKNLFSLLIEYFLLQINVIGFEEDYQISNINKLNFLFVFIISLLLFFYFSISFYEIIKLWRPVINESSDILSQISSAIISDGAHGILIFNSIFSFVFSC